MRALFFTVLVGAVVGHLVLNSARAQESISGSVVIDRHTDANRFGIQTSDHFDVEQTRARAERAVAEGDLETAFYDFLAVCSAGGASSCLNAAQIAEAGHVPKIPHGLTEQLYAEACAGGVQDACDTPYRSK